MRKIFALICLMSIICFPASAQELDNLKNLKRPRYELFLDQPTIEPPPKQTADKNGTIATEATDNSRFAGTYKGMVTVHYKNNMVQTEATLRIFTGRDGQNSHYDSYIIPESGDYLESSWQLDKNEVLRSVTVSGNTIYVTDIIEYGRGGNSQIRTLVFSPDCSALTFLKTEFDDSSRNPATGQSIGRFLRVK